MKINLNRNNNDNQTAFKARNAEIRLADNIMRRANLEFIKFSPSRHYWNILDKNNISPKQAKKLKELQKLVEELRLSRPTYNNNPDLYIRKLLFDIKTKKLGNCGESASLSKIACALHNIDGKKVSLFGYTGKNIRTSLDHSFIIINLAKDADLSNYKTFGKKAYIMDLWEGFVDYVPNAFKKFEAIYANDIRMGIINSLGIRINDFDINPKTLDQIKTTFPNLIVKQKT